VPQRANIRYSERVKENNMNFWESFAIGAAASAIRTFVKNPKAAAQYQTVLQHIYDDLGQVLAALGSTAPPPTP